ncbi:MAG: DNA-protecting protein DprA [Steroidobacteraceae bacterium]|nr:DNA-protecting protein DprA [Steroidobacteraceae bacterium]
MPSSDPRLAWATLARTPGLSSATLSTALETLGGAAGILDASDSARARAGLTTTAREFLNSAAATPTESERRWLEEPDHDLLGQNDPRFPARLRAIGDAPTAIWVEGQMALLGEPQLAIVGSRNPTAQGRENAFSFAKYMARQGLTITSGLAAGIDSEAHRGALAAAGTTIAVLGSGLDVIYPTQNVALAAEIRLHGALISEFAPGTPARREHFPRRNRLIAALSLGVLVVEAARRSGSLITARLAGEYGREVFAIPGSIHNPLAHGCHQLIRQGAKLTENAEDVLGELDFSGDLGPGTAPTSADAPPGGAPAGMDKDHKILLDALGFDPADIDTLVARTGFKADAVSSMMLILELEGQVRAAPGGRYSRVARSQWGER